jgi:hypothetical protein
MGNETTFQNKMLVVEMSENPEEILFQFTGKSIERDPGTFLNPLIHDALERLGVRRLVLNFSDLGYMNSSSVTPVIKLLNEIKAGGQSIRIVYAKALKWQELSFSALKVFQTRDGRIEVVGH